MHSIQLVKERKNMPHEIQGLIDYINSIVTALFFGCKSNLLLLPV